MAGEWAEVAVLVLCRVGGCIGVAAGYASARVPVTIRLFLAIAVSLAVLPLLEPALRPLVAGKGPVAFLLTASVELAIGLGIGLVSRMFLLALEFMSELIGQAIGLGGGPRAGIESDQPLSPLSDLLTLTALTIVFASGLHLSALKALIESYDMLRPGGDLDPTRLLGDLIRVLTAAFRTGLQIAAPFLLFSILVNVLLGLATRMIPQLPMQFVGGPMLLVGGIALTWIVLGPALGQLLDAIAKALVR